jgi:phosphoglycerol transferase
MAALREQPLFDPGAVIGDERGRRAAALLTGGICFIIGSAGVYYAAFTVLLLLLGAAMVIGRAKGRRVAAHALLAISIICVTLGLNLAPSLLHRATAGTNNEVGQRSPYDSETFALSLIDMVLPTDEHRLGPWGDVRTTFSNSTPIPGENAYLGIIGLAALTFLLFVLVRSAAGRSPPGVPPLIRLAAVAAAFAFLIGTAGGISSIVARGITDQIRSWNRISVFIAFFALLAVGWAFPLIVRRLQRRVPERIAVVGLAACLIGLAVSDQAGRARAGQFDQDLIAPQWQSDEAFVEGLEDRLSPGSAILQLPYLKHPEGYPPPGTMEDYDPFRGYLHSETLRWSYGAMKGRSADFLACLQTAKGERLEAVARAFGFSAIWLDRRGYLQPESTTERSLRAAIGMPLLESPDGRFVAFRVEGASELPALENALRLAMPAADRDLQDCGPLAAALATAGGPNATAAGGAL